MFGELKSQEFLQNPVPVIERMRAQGPFVPLKVPILGKVLLTTTHSTAAQILKNDESFRMRKADGRVVGLSWWMPRMLTRLTTNMLSSDEPEHGRLRGIVDQAFHRRSVMQLEDRIIELASEYADALFAHGPRADLVAGYARKLPLAVICEVLGLPREDWPNFTRWAGRLTTINGVMSFLFGVHKLRPLTRYIENRIAHERRHGGTGLVHALVHPQDPAQQLTDNELVAMVFLLLLAGHETTTHLISGGVLALLQHCDQRELLTSDWSHLDLAVEEMLRFVSPVQVTKPRYVHADCAVDGARLRRGEIVMPFLAAANLDPIVFDAPEKFDITRRPNRHIEFGTGPHFCLGHQLARLEMKAAVRALFKRSAPLRLAVPADQIRWNERFGLRSLKHLDVSSS